MQEEQRIKQSRKLARLLRFDKSYPFKVGGWRSVSDLVENHGYTPEELEIIVASDEKHRYEFSDNRDYIRALRGHAKWMCLEKKDPADIYPARLFHGTNLNVVDAILEKGILPMERAYVHLSENKTTALTVGARHKKPVSLPVVLSVDTNSLTRFGNTLYPPESDAWLADSVSPQAIEKNMFIGQVVAYYESEDQSKAILAICNDSRTHQQIANKFIGEKESSILSANHIDGVSEFAERITFDNDCKSRTITAFLSVRVDSDIKSYEQATELLSSYIRELQQYYLSEPVINLMPSVQIKDRQKALFYLEMSMWYNCGSRKFLKPVDWFDIKRCWETSSVYNFKEPLVSDGIKHLFTHILGFIEAYNGNNNTRFIIWLDFPEDRASHYSEVQDFLVTMRQKGICPLVCISSVPEQNDYMALLSVLEGLS